MLRIKDSSDHIEPFELEQQSRNQTTPSIPSEFEKLTDELQMKILCKVIFGKANFSTVNKSWRKMIKGIILARNALPLHKRDELIQSLYHRAIRSGNDLENERLKKLINIYQNNTTLNSNSAVKFLYDFLKPNNVKDSSEDENSEIQDSENENEYESEAQSSEDENKIQKINEMIHAWELYYPINSNASIDSIGFLKSLLHDRKIEEAFALAATMDDEDTFAYSILIQEYLLDGEDGLGLSLDQAYKLTEALNTTTTRIPAITAFVIVGCKKFKVPKEVNVALTKMQVLLEHPFITFIRNNEVKSLPRSAVLYLIARINSLLNCKSKYSKVNEMLCFIIKRLFNVIPMDFEFSESSETDSKECSNLINSFQNPLYRDGIVPMSDEFMAEDTTADFIFAINGIPHLGLKKQIFENVMYGFYSENPNMHVWLPIIERIERKTNQLPKAFQQLVLQYLNNDLKKFMVEFNKVDQFSRLIALLKECPDWIKGFEPCSKKFKDKYDFQNACDRALGIYKSVIRLLIDHDEKELARRIIKNVKSEAMKIELKNQFHEIKMD